MASKKNFLGKKPEIQVEADAVEAFMNKAPAHEKKAIPEKIQEKPAEDPAEQEEVKASAPVSPTPFSRKAKVNKDNKRSRRLQLLITEEEANYLAAISWENRRSVNDYMNWLIEQDMKKNPDTAKAFKGGK